MIWSYACGMRRDGFFHSEESFIGQRFGFAPESYLRYSGRFSRIEEKM